MIFQALMKILRILITYHFYRWFDSKSYRLGGGKALLFSTSEISCYNPNFGEVYVKTGETYYVAKIGK